MSKVLKIRVDQLLVERGHAESRTRAQALVLAGTGGAGGFASAGGTARNCCESPGVARR